MLLEKASVGGQEVLRWSCCFSRSWEREAGEGKEEVSPRGDKNHSPADKYRIS